MGEQEGVSNKIGDSTFNGPVIQARTVVQVIAKWPLPVLALVMAVVAAVSTYLVVSAGGDDGPRLSARYSPGPVDSGYAMLAKPFGPTGIPTSVSGCTGTLEWLRAQGGADVGTSRLVVEVSGGTGHTVVVRGVKATLVGTPQDPPPGTAAGCSPEGEGTAVELGLDLDSADRVALIGTSRGEISYAPYFTDKYLYLEDRKPEVINLSVLAERKSYEYVLTVDGSVDGKPRTWTLRDGDRPFRIAGLRSGYGSHLAAIGGIGWMTQYDGWQWGSSPRCSPCFDQDKEIPATKRPGPPGSTVSLKPPAVRPADPMPSLTVIPNDPESVAVAWAIAANSIDVRRGDTTIRQMRPYLTPGLLATVEADAAGPEPDNPVGPPTGVTVHQGWSVVEKASARPEGRGWGLTGEPGEDTVRLLVDVKLTYYAEGGWSEPGAEFTGTATLRRQPDGTYLVDAFQSSPPAQP